MLSKKKKKIELYYLLDNNNFEDVMILFLNR